ncbi:O18-antigen biosynthesis glycosyltransferase [Janthinobacterium sp. CG_23.3]|uniref:glycosyltransferase family 2 protein n=1 Tax=Janthinobacterium sp. CG_23.3 TaxID=3349634 RepID=UPI0038D440A5
MITVLTPTYNRAYILERVFQCLQQQTDRQFEWLVVDDGSTDATEELVRGWTGQADFSVRYVHQKNGGKHIAINTGAVQAAGDWVLILDSDDALSDDAIAAIRLAIADHAAPDLAGVCFRKSHFSGGLIGESKPLEPKQFLHPTAAGHLLKGDLAYVFKRSSLLAHPFPVIPGEQFVPELYIWNKIGDAGRILFMTMQSIYLCDYLPDGYSKNFLQNLRRNPQGFLTYYRSQFSREKIGLQKLKCAVRSLQCLYYALMKKNSV